MFKSISDMFRPVQAVTPAATPPQPSPQNPLVQQNPGADASQVPPSGSSQNAAPAEPANPMDKFKDLWQTDPKAQPNVDPLSQPLFNTDPSKIQEAAGKIDFISMVPQDIMAKAMSGQDPQAFAQVINFVAQKSLATATQLSTATVEQATARNNERFQQVLPDRFKKFQLDSLQSDNPALQHPAAQPLLNSVRAQIQMKNPDLSPAEVQKMAEGYLSDFAGQFSGGAAGQGSQQQATQGGTDWEMFLKE